MTRRGIAIVLAAIVDLALLVSPLQGHHSFAAFDTNQRVTWEGVITRVEWKSPHSWVYIAVTDANGKTVEWGFESTSPAQLAPRIKPNLLKAGVKITVKGAPGRDPALHIGTFEEFTVDGTTYYPMRPSGRERGTP